MVLSGLLVIDTEDMASLQTRAAVAWDRDGLLVRVRHGVLVEDFATVSGSVRRWGDSNGRKQDGQDGGHARGVRDLDCGRIHERCNRASIYGLALREQERKLAAGSLSWIKPLQARRVRLF